MIQKLTNIGKDKWMHVSVSACLAATIKTILRPIIGEGEAMFVAFAVTCLVGIGKELYDKDTGKGNCEWQDVVADIIGALVGVA